jgi:predicted DsbA family dithiol-disulfide isomerase
MRESRVGTDLEIAVYQDVFCAWCYVAEARLEPLRRELGEAVRWSFRPYALRLEDTPLTPKERSDCIRELEAAQQEKEGARLSSELWTQEEPPRSSIPPLLALEAARLQGADALGGLLGALRRAALEQGVDVSRTDVLLEIAGALGLDLNRFIAAFQSPQTRRLVLQEHRLAHQRGVRGVPSLVLDNRWMISGLREVEDYRSLILGCLRKHAQRSAGPTAHLLH